jgi:hypothetical protein
MSTTPVHPDAKPEAQEPGWLARLRPAAQQRPRTQFVRVRWHDLQEPLREYDRLWNDASEQTRSAIDATRREYGRAFG